ncbi:hypothetical protein [Parapedobacter soli]|nr:hypothetical protein [Parapedobacter soli]
MIGGIIPSDFADHVPDIQTVGIHPRRKGQGLKEVGIINDIP